MPRPFITMLLAVGLAFGLWVLASDTTAWRLPDNQQGYAPQQPIAFSHRLHAGELAIDCRFCHHHADTSRHAGIPASDVCMKCHRFVTAPLAVVRDDAPKADAEGRDPKRAVSPELRKLYDAMGLDAQLQPAAESSPRAIPWVRVHDLPDYVYFDHRAHAAAGVDCQRCHGPVESMERVRQHSDLSMGWCVNCHREARQRSVEEKTVRASTDCAVCHY